MKQVAYASSPQDVIPELAAATGFKFLADFHGSHSILFLSDHLFSVIKFLNVSTETLFGTKMLNIEMHLVAKVGAI